MKLEDYMRLVTDDTEVTIWDKEIDIEVYGYKEMIEENTLFKFLADKVKITKIFERGIEVDFYNYFENNKIKSLKVWNDIFTAKSNLDDIIMDWVEMLHPIFAGSISESAEQEIIKLFKENM